MSNEFFAKMVTVIIPNWNGFRFVGLCLESLHKSLYKNYEIIVVDNGSSDGSVGFIEENYPDVKLVKLKKNIGFAGACNRGIKKSSGDYIFLLNNDVEVEPDYIKELVAFLEGNQGYGMVTGKMLKYHNRSCFDAVGDCLSIGGAPTNRGHNCEDQGQFDDPVDVFGVCAGASLYRRSLFDEIGLFDEDFFAYIEDVDLDLRSLLAGHKARYIPHTRCYHHGGATIGALSPRHVFLTNRNKIFVIIKNFKLTWIIKHFSEIFRHQLEMAELFSFTRRGRSFFLSRISAMIKIPKMVVKRYLLFASKEINWDQTYEFLEKIKR